MKGLGFKKYEISGHFSYFFKTNFNTGIIKSILLKNIFPIIKGKDVFSRKINKNIFYIFIVLNFLNKSFINDIYAIS